MLIMRAREGVGGGVYGNSEHSAQFFCKLKTILKINSNKSKNVKGIRKAYEVNTKLKTLE